MTDRLVRCTNKRCALHGIEVTTEITSCLSCGEKLTSIVDDLAAAFTKAAFFR